MNMLIKTNMPLNTFEINMVIETEILLNPSKLSNDTFTKCTLFIHVC